MFPVSGPPLDHATVVFVDGKITVVGAKLAPPPGARVIDGKGKWVTLGLINAATRLGLVEVGAVAATSDGTAKGETFNVPNIRQHAGNAVAYGRSWDDALRAVTLAPAEVFGVGDTVGSLAPGKDANLVVWDGDPFEFATRAELVFVWDRNGHAIAAGRAHRTLQIAGTKAALRP